MQLVSAGPVRASLPQTESNSNTSVLWGENDPKLTSTEVVSSFNVQQRKVYPHKGALPFFSPHPMCLEDPAGILTCSIAPAQQLLFRVRAWLQCVPLPILLSSCFLPSQPDFLAGNLLAQTGLQVLSIERGYQRHREDLSWVSATVSVHSPVRRD